jgi:Fic family protein
MLKSLHLRKYVMPKQTYILPKLPPDVDFETPEILKELNKASRALAEFKGEAKAIPNQQILLNTLFLQEALASSKIENIITTEDELFQIDLFPDNGSDNTKEVARYRDALHLGFNEMQQMEGVISNNLLVKLFQELKQLKDGFRKTPGTVLRNEQTGENVYVPPQEYDEIIRLMSELESFINQDDACDLDPLIKMAIIHHQFESIHPFSDGNGRIGRILNVLYLTKTGLLDTPILYISREIVRTKLKYYALLQETRDSGQWQEWVCYILKCVTTTAVQGLALVRNIKTLMQEYKNRMRQDLPKIYSQDLLNNLFRHPYTRIEFVTKDLHVTRQTASTYLGQLVEYNFVSEVKIGPAKYYINNELVKLFIEVSDE